jgi:uncharacterized membrane protein
MCAWLGSCCPAYGTTTFQQSKLEEVSVEQEKDNFWVYIGGFIVLVIALVFMFKNMHKEAIPEKAYSETSKQIDEQIARTKQAN